MSAAKTKRVYHPQFDVFHDVPAGAADGWKAMGWRFTNPGHVDEDVEHPILSTATNATLVTAADDPSITE